MVPENFTSVIRRAAPKTVVIVDSAEMGIKPGEFRIRNEGDARIAVLSSAAVALEEAYTRAA